MERLLPFNDNNDCLKNLSLQERLANENCVVVSKKDLMSKEKIDAICSASKEKFVVLKMPFEDNTKNCCNSLFVQRELSHFFLVENYIRDCYGKNLFVYGGYSLSSVAKASEYFCNLTDSLNNAVVEGEFLSPLEKCLVVHDFAAGFIYGRSDNPVTYKSIYGVLLGGVADCKGISTLSTALLNACNVPAYTQSVIIKDGESYNFDDDFHSVCRILLFDPKYRIKGLYVCDATFDIDDTQTYPNLDYAILPWEQYAVKTNAEKDIQGDGKDVLNVYKNITKQKLFGLNVKRFDLLEVKTEKIPRHILIEAMRRVLLFKGKQNEDALKEAVERVDKMSEKTAYKNFERQ